MANPTTNYGFVLPTPSDLVTDLPADFDVALQGVDTRLKALQPGTTLGDIAYSSATANTNTRLGIGTTGQVLTVAAGVPSWATASAGSSNVAGKNAVLNSAMNVWQRGTSISLAASSGTTFLADRWCVQTGANQACTVSRQATGDTTNLPFIQYAMRFQRNSGQTGTGAIGIMQPMETINTIPFAGKTATLSFYARKGADYSATSNALLAYLRTGTGTDQNPYAGYTGDNTSINTTATLTTTWQRFSVTGTLDATVTEMTVQFGFTPTGTASTNDYYEVTGVQVEIAGSASAYSPNAATFQAELAACQRYYQSYGAYELTGDLYAAGGGVFFKDLICQMRTTATVTYPAGPYTNDLEQFLVGATTPTALASATFTPNSFTFYASGGSGLTGGFPCTWTGSTIQLSSEL